MDIVSAKGILDIAVVSRAMLQLRNIPDRDSKLSPAKALYGRELRDLLPRPGWVLMGEMWNIVTYGGPCLLRTYGPKIQANLESAIRNIS